MQGMASRDPRGTDRPSGHVVALRRSFSVGIAILILFGGTFGVWAGLSTLSGAVVATGQFMVDSNVKKVQHPTGGIVGELRVREGDVVRQGDLIVKLDETVTKANLDVIRKQLDELHARLGRLEAERDGIDQVAFDEALAERMNDPAVAKLTNGERRLFEARREARDGQRAQLTKRIQQARNEIEGLRAQMKSREQQAIFIQQELEGVRDLYEKKLVQINRLSQLERAAADLVGQRGQIIASIAQSEGKISETELQILQIDTDMRAEVMRDLRETQGRVAELQERRVAAEDQLRRVDIRAPADGIVHQMNVFTVGGVVTPADPLMLIVPKNEGLVLEAKVLPQDIDQIAIGQKAVVRVHAFNQRTTPEITGAISRIGADVTKDPQTQMTYYTIRVALPPEEVVKLGSGKLIAGMQADVYVQTADRSPFEYFVKPLTDQMSKMFRER